MIPLVYLSIGYGVSELLLLIFKRSKAGSVKTRSDSGSLIFLWLMITLGIAGGFFLSRPANMFWSGFGIPLILAGIIYRWVAILQLGKSFTVDVAITSSAKLKTDGIYERIRHPSYFGIILIVTGFSAAMNSIYSFLVLVIPVTAAVLYRINVEEDLLIKEFGKSYLDYKSVTKKLIPGLY
jgi:protein-S-isoprenylcysteine O-methyltransferase Ste14